jgi:hypothetical protein
MTIFNQLINIPLLSRIRRNHGLEHATLHILARLHPGKRLAGHSDFNGFWITGDLNLQEIDQAVQEALLRLKNGESKLAVHPNCGTNFATAGSLAGLAGVIGMLGVGNRKRDKLERFPMIAVLATVALIAAQPLGMKIQKNLTTSADLGDLEIIKITTVNQNQYKVFRIITQG